MLDEKEESYAQDAKWAVTHSPLVWGLIKHFCAHKLCTTVKVHSAVHYKSIGEKNSYIVLTLINTFAGGPSA